MVYKAMCAGVGIVVGLVIFPKTAVNHGERVRGNLDQCLPSLALLLKLFELGAVQADIVGVEDHLQILQSDSYDSTEVRVVREADLRRPGWWW